MEFGPRALGNRSILPRLKCYSPKPQPVHQAPRVIPQVRRLRPAELAAEYFETGPTRAPRQCGACEAGASQTFAAALLGGDLIRVHTVAAMTIPSTGPAACRRKESGLPVLYNTHSTYSENRWSAPRDAVRSFFPAHRRPLRRQLLLQK